MSFDFLPAEISGVYLGKFPQTLYTYSLLPKPYSLVRCRRRRGRSVSGSPPVSCLFISCKTPAAALRSAAEIEPFMSTLRNLKISFQGLC